MKEAIAYYLISINILTFFVFGIDKWKAVHSKWRIPETTLITLAAIGGGIGALLGMKTWHHKTKHLKFIYGVPAIIILQLVIIGYIIFKS